jgi:transposase
VVVATIQMQFASRIANGHTTCRFMESHGNKAIINLKLTLITVRLHKLSLHVSEQKIRSNTIKYANALLVPSSV